MLGFEVLQKEEVPSYCLRAFRREGYLNQFRYGIIGDGTIGHVVAHALRVRGVQSKNITLFGINPRKLDLAKYLCNTQLYNGREIRELKGYEEEMDFVVECVGEQAASTTMSLAQYLLKVSGSVVHLGMGGGAMELSIDADVRKNIVIRGSNKALPMDMLEIIRALSTHDAAHNPQLYKGVIPVLRVPVRKAEDVARAYKLFEHNSFNKENRTRQMGVDDLFLKVVMQF